MLTPRMIRFQAAVLALFLSTDQSTVLAFTSVGNINHVAATTATGTTTRPHQPRALYAVDATALSADKGLYDRPLGSTSRPTDEEQCTLLQKAVEHRRLKALRNEAHLRQPSGMGSSTLQLAQQAGYGNELQAYETALEEGYQAREALVTRNMGLVHYCVNEIVGKRTLQSLSREDLLQEGAIGLARAVDKWNPDIGGKFSTYAVYWVRAAILRGIAERDDAVRVPEHALAAVRKATKAAAQLGIVIDGDNLLKSVYSGSSKQASWTEAKAAKMLAKQAGLTEAQLAQALKVRKRRNKGVTSFETWMQRGKDLASDTTTVGTMSAESSSFSKESDGSKEALREELSRFLRPREMEALSWRYGLVTPMSEPSKATASKSRRSAPNKYLARAEEELFGTSSSAAAPSPTSGGGRWGEAMSFTEVGQRMHVSAEYGRRLCHVALAKLKRAAEEGNLSPSLLATCN